MTATFRFAPSPTGRLHIGNIRTAILNWIFARKLGGRFILRLDDTDRTRSTEEFAQAIRTDLSWLGLTWDEQIRQSERTERYAEVAEALKAAGRLYPCYETEEELARKRKRQLGRGLPPLYDRAGLRLEPEQRASLEAEGRRPHWRFRLENTEPGSLEPTDTIVSWNDAIRGDQTVDVGSLSDPVLIRADGTFLYTFTSVVDDVDLVVTHVVRGEDHVTNTGVQIQLFEALGRDPPVFAHHSLPAGADGQALPKRLGALSSESLRARGLEPMAVASHAALVGTSEPIEPRHALDELVGIMEFHKISTAAARFDQAELEALNAKLLHTLGYAEVADRLAHLGIRGGPAFWYAVRGNLVVLADALQWWLVVDGEISPTIESPELLARAADLLPAEPWDQSTWTIWTDAIKAATGVKGRALFHPLRLALTGRESGPELKGLLPLIGRARTASRLAVRRT